MRHRQIEVVVDKWPIGRGNRVHSRGERAIVDEKAAFILVGMGKVRYVDDEEPVPRSAPKRQYKRRDMKAED